MNVRKLPRYFCGMAVASTVAVAGFGQETAKPPEKANAATPGGRHGYYVGPMAGNPKKAAAIENRATSSGSGAFGAAAVSEGEGANENGGGLPLWTFRVHSSRDGNSYPGAMVGSNPFTDPETTTVPTVVIPVESKRG